MYVQEDYKMNEIIDLYLNGEYNTKSSKEISDNAYYFLHPEYFDCLEYTE